MENYIWLFGENRGNTANNNSFYFWKEVCNIKDGIDKYYVMYKNKQNKKVYASLSREEKKKVLWKNSIKHWIKYKKADMLFVTLSFVDVKPKTLFKLKLARKGLSAPLVYLQHGTLGIKKIGYKGNSYWNNMFRFIYYNPDIKDVLINENSFEDYQLTYGVYHPRYKELLKKNDYYKELKKQNEEKNILWFITWREYFGDNNETKKFLNQLEQTINNYKLNKFLKEKKYKLKICLHQFFDKEKINMLTKHLDGTSIDIVSPKDIDVMDEIAKNDILITDYSSLGFDFTFLNKKVIIYQPDAKIYSKYREFYYPDEIAKNAITTQNGLVNKLIEDDNQINDFFRNKFPEYIDHDYVREGKHILDMYNHFADIQKNDITFIGYNFYGKGGTVNATKAITEGLLKQGKLVKLISLKKHTWKGEFPGGLNVKCFFYPRGNKIINCVKLALSIPRWGRTFKYDPNKKYLIPYIEGALKRKLKNIHSRTVVSTRESFHPYLKKAKSDAIKKKVYFFHTDYKVLQEQFVGLIDQLKKIELENAVFVTKNAQNNYKEKLNYDNYQNSIVIPNCLEDSKIIKEDEIQPIKAKRKVKAVYLLRVSKDRVKDLENLLNFAEYLKENEDNKIHIDVYGKGDYEKEFSDLIVKKKVEKYVEFKGVSEDVKETLKDYDCMIDFSLNHSFGMTYIEAILNGKMLFAMKNGGSLEVLKDIPNCYIESYEDLYNKLKNLNKIKLEDLKENYRIISEKFSQEKTAKEFINYIEEIGDKNEI